MKDNKFNRQFCDKWDELRAFLSTWQGLAKNPILKGAIGLVISFGDGKHKECPTIGK